MDESTKLLIIVVVSGLCAVLLGPRVANEAHSRDKVLSGPFAKLLNLIGAMAFAGLVPGVLAGIIIGGAHVAVPLALGLLATCFLSTLLFAVVEMPVRRTLPVKPVEEEELWTAEKARTSGL
jgi:hypothetical protein